jgi:hypothetical protein
MKLFQIEEPDGSPAATGLPGAAIGIDASGAAAEAAIAVGGNAVVLRDRAEFAGILRVPAASARVADWRALFEGLRRRAERLLARPVTHAVVVLAASPAAAGATLRQAAAEAGIEILRMPTAAQLSGGDEPALAAALLAEELMPRPGTRRPDLAYFR